MVAINHSSIAIQLSNSDRKVVNSLQNNFNAISDADLDWMAEQPKEVIRLWRDCWKADKFGNRFMPLRTDISDRSFRRAKAVLAKNGLFKFKKEIIADAHGTTEAWQCLNLHGSHAKKLQIIDGKNLSGVGQNLSGVGQNLAKDDLKLAKFEVLNPCQVSISDSVQILNSDLNLRSSSDRAHTAAPLPEEEIKNFEEKREEAGQSEFVGKEGEKENLEGEEIQNLTPPPAPQKSNTPHRRLDAPTTDANLLAWVINHKIPSMELDEPPRNLEKYAIAMIKRDGEELSKEFQDWEDLQRRRVEVAEFERRCQEKVAEWRERGVEICTIFYSGNPDNPYIHRLRVSVDGIDYDAEKFLTLPFPGPEDSEAAAEAKRKFSEARIRFEQQMKAQKAQKAQKRLQRLGYWEPKF